MDSLVQFDFVRRQSEVSLNVEKDYNSNAISISKYTPPRKLVQRSNTYTPKDLPRVNRPPEIIALPDRFRWKIRKKSSSQNVGNINLSSLSILENIDEEATFDFSDKWEDRKSDMDDAIKWVRQEINNLRRQDKVLKKRLHDLSATIQQLRGIQSCPSLAHSRSSISSGASWLSLDDGTFAAQFGDRQIPITGAIQRDNMWAFRATMLAEFQKSRPNLIIQSKSVSLCNVRNTSEEDIKNFRSSSNSSSSSAVFAPTGSSCSGDEDDDIDALNSDQLVPSRSDSLVNSVEEESSLECCSQTSNNNDNDNINDEDEEVESDTLKLRKRIVSISSDDSSTDQDSVSYDDSTLTRDNNNDKTMTDSLEDILTAVSTQEEREGLIVEDETEYIV